MARALVDARRQGTYSRFMRIRVYDCWLHELDIRDAIKASATDHGLPTVVALDEIATRLGYIVGRKARAPEGASVTFEIGDPLERRFHVKVDGRAAVVDSLDDADTVLRMSVETFAGLTGGRGELASRVAEVEVDGDQELGQHIARHIAFTV